MSGWLDWFVWPWLQDLLTPAAAPKLKAEQISVPTCAEGLVIPEVLGTVKLAGNIIWYGYNRSKKLKTSTGGKGGGTEVVTGYRYYLTWAVGLCGGPVDKIYAAICNDKPVWKSQTGLAAPGSGGKQTLTLTGMDGTCDFYYGTTDQVGATRIGLKVGTTLNPGYRRTCWAFMNDVKCGSSNRAPAYSFIVQHTPALAFNANHLIGDYDYNPAHALYYALVTLAGLDSTWIDETSFSAAADTLYAEGRGISMVFDRPGSAQNYCEDILRHIDGMLYLTAAGAIGLRLLRADEDVEDLPAFDGADFERPPTISWPDTPDLFNQIKASYVKRIDPTATKAMTFKDASIGVKSLAGIRAAGARTKSVSFPFFTTQDNAEWAASRTLRGAANALAKVNFTATREAFQLEPGDAFVFSYAPRGVSGMVCRVAGVKESELEFGELLEITAAQDPNYLGEQAVVVSGGLAEEEENDLVGLPHVVAIELPYLDGSEAGAVAMLAARMAGSEIGYTVYVSPDGSSYTQIGQGNNFCVFGLLVGGYGVTNRIDDGDVGLVVQIDDDADLIETIGRASVIAGDNLFYVDGEFMACQTVTPLGSDQYRLTGIVRGLYDTEPVDHLDEAEFYFIGRIENLDRITSGLISAGSTRYFKVVPFTGSTGGDLADATAATLAVVDRTRLPYPPASLQANGSGIRPTYTADIDLTWRTRVRGTGAGIGGEDGVTDADPAWEGTFEIEVEVGAAVVRSVSAIDDDTWTYTAAMNAADNGSPADEVTLRVRGVIDQNHKSAWTTVVVLKS